jgi:hypothetical protein
MTGTQLCRSVRTRCDLLLAACCLLLAACCLLLAACCLLHAAVYPISPRDSELTWLLSLQVLTSLVRCHPLFVETPAALVDLLTKIKESLSDCSSGAKRARLTLLQRIVQVQLA